MLKYLSSKKMEGRLFNIAFEDDKEDYCEESISEKYWYFVAK